MFAFFRVAGVTALATTLFASLPAAADGLSLNQVSASAGSQSDADAVIALILDQSAALHAGFCKSQMITEPFGVAATGDFGDARELSYFGALAFAISGLEIQTPADDDNSTRGNPPPGTHGGLTSGAAGGSVGSVVGGASTASEQPYLMIPAPGAVVLAMLGIVALLRTHRSA